MARQDGQVAESESLYVRLAAVYRRQPGYVPNDVVLTLLRIAGLRVDAGDLAGAVAAYDSLIPQLVQHNRSDSLDLGKKWKGWQANLRMSTGHLLQTLVRETKNLSVTGETPDCCMQG